MKTIFIDIDGILTQETDGHIYEKRTPNKGNINLVNRLYKKGHHIVLWTSRWGMDDQDTRDWLRKYDVKYSDILYDKPVYDIFIDDKNLNTFYCNRIQALLDK